MTDANAATLANLLRLRAFANESLRAVAVASQDGTMQDWQAAREAAKAPCAAEVAEVTRIRASGWGDNGELEFPVQGYLSRRHSDPCIVRYDDLRG